MLTDRQTNKQTNRENGDGAACVYTPFFVVDNTPIWADNARLNEGPTKSDAACIFFFWGGVIYCQCNSVLTKSELLRFTRSKDRKVSSNLKAVMYLMHIPSFGDNGHQLLVSTCYSQFVGLYRILEIELH